MSPVRRVLLTNPLTDPYECFPRYLYRYYREGTLHSERAANAREECKKLKNIAKTVTQVTHVPSASPYWSLG